MTAGTHPRFERPKECRAALVAAGVTGKSDVRGDGRMRK